MKKQSETNPGVLALRRCGKTQSEIARACGVSAQTAHRWWNGAVPGLEHQARLEALGWVKAEQWARGAPKAPVRAAPPVAPAPVRGGATVDTRDKLQSQVQRLEALLGESLSASSAVQVEKALGSALSSLSKLDGAQITETTLLRHPAHQRLMATIFAALQAFPEAARAVADALKAAQ